MNSLNGTPVAGRLLRRNSDHRAIEIVVFRLPRSTRSVIDGNAAHIPSGAQHQCGQVAVHMIEVGQIEKCSALEQLDAAASVGGVIAQQTAANGVGKARCDAFTAAVLAMRDESQAISECRQDRSGRRRRAW